MRRCRQIAQDLAGAAGVADHTLHPGGVHANPYSIVAGERIRDRIIDDAPHVECLTIKFEASIDAHDLIQVLDQVGHRRRAGRDPLEVVEPRGI